MLRAFLYWVSQKRWLLYAIVISSVMYHLPYPSDISTDAYRTLILTLIVIILIISEAVPLPGIALLIAVLQVVFAIAEPSEVAATYMSDAVFFIMGSLMLAVAIVKQGLDARLTLVILAITGASVRSIMWGFYIIAILLTSFMGPAGGFICTGKSTYSPSEIRAPSKFRNNDFNWNSPGNSVLASMDKTPLTGRPNCAMRTSATAGPSAQLLVPSPVPEIVQSKLKSKGAAAALPASNINVARVPKSVNIFIEFSLNYLLLENAQNPCPAHKLSLDQGVTLPCDVRHVIVQELPTMTPGAL